ncbi:MAG: AAA family ATPase, partial [Desulfococcaceae bacterium]
AELEQIIREEAARWTREHDGVKVVTHRSTLDRLTRALGGLPVTDARRLARNAIYNDGAITESDLPEINKAKFELLGMDGMLGFEYETESFGNVGGLRRLKQWLRQREPAFAGDPAAAGLDPPRGILLLGVQGSGKSLAAKATAGVWGVPLLRLDFGALYDKFFGESERNLRNALKTAEVMAPCVLWVDEIEKGLSLGDNEGGTSRRVLGALLTWMADRPAPVFLVATANDISSLPPELVRKGRLDEIFFVDLPAEEIRMEIFRIHLNRRNQDPSNFDLSKMARATEGFSGAEIEAAVVAGLYSAVARKESLSTDHLLTEIANTRPLSVVMAEQVDHLRRWAEPRTVPAD